MFGKQHLQIHHSEGALMTQTCFSLLHLHSLTSSKLEPSHLQEQQTRSLKATPWSGPVPLKAAVFSSCLGGLPPKILNFLWAGRESQTKRKAPCWDDHLATTLAKQAYELQSCPIAHWPCKISSPVLANVPVDRLFLIATVGGFCGRGTQVARVLRSKWIRLVCTASLDRRCIF